MGYAVSEVDGSPIFYTVSEPSHTPLPAEIRGGDTVVFCDGIGCDGYVWKYLGRHLEPSFRVLHWHYRGHGRTPPPRDPGRLAIADLAGDLNSVLADCDVARAVLFGHSMGVQVVLETYRRHRTRVAGLGLICGAPENPLRTFHGHAALEQLLPAVRYVVGRAPRLFRGLARRLIPTQLAYALAARLEVNAHLLEFTDFMPYLRGLSRVDPTLFLDMLAQAGQHSARDLLPTIDVPTLIIAGSRDGFTPPELSRAMHESIRESELVVVERGSHTAPIERPHLVNRAVRDFLRRRFGL